MMNVSGAVYQIDGVILLFTNLLPFFSSLSNFCVLKLVSVVFMDDKIILAIVVLPCS